MRLVNCGFPGRVANWPHERRRRRCIGDVHREGEDKGVAATSLHRGSPRQSSLNKSLASSPFDIRRNPG